LAADKKKARRRGITIVFYDEFGFSFLEALRRTWAPRGQQPVLPRPTQDRRALTTAVGFTLDGKIYKRHFAGGMASPEVVTAMEHLRRYLPDGFILICDRAPIHTSEHCVRYFWEHPEICVEPLPKYAPDLNPEEFCHGNVKHQLANLTPADKTVIRHSLDRGFARLRRRPDLLLSFIHAAHLPVRRLWST
jgi:transposase